MVINFFLSEFINVIEKKIRIGKTFPPYLESYFENLKLLNKFPRLVEIRNRIPKTEILLREKIRKMFERVFGESWRKKVAKELPKKVKKFENTINKRPDKGNIVDFLDGATFGELIELLRRYHKDLLKDKDPNIRGAILNALNYVNKHRRLLEHPIKEQSEDLDEKTYNELKAMLSIIESFL